MVNYDFLKKIDPLLFLQLVKRGIIPMHVMDYITVYETYLQESKLNKKSISITYCSEKYNCSERTIKRIIEFMTK